MNFVQQFECEQERRYLKSWADRIAVCRRSPPVSSALEAVIRRACPIHGERTVHESSTRVWNHAVPRQS